MPRWTYDEYHRGRHVVYNLYIHLVFVTKYRKGCLTKEMIDYLSDIFDNIADDLGIRITEYNGERDHIHLLINYKPNITISKIANFIKGISSRYMRKKFNKELKPYLWGNHLWSSSYFVVSCGGAPLETIKKYIQNQKTPGFMKDKDLIGNCTHSHKSNVTHEQY